MLSPREHRIILLPEDRELIKLLGCTEAEYREFVRACRGASQIKPGEPVAIGLDIILLQIGIALVTAAAAYFLSPKPKTQSRGAAPQLRSQTVDGQSIVQGNRYAPKAGFDQLQNVVEMGSVVPLVYAHRETIEGQDYGGVRVNTNLLWSQVLSLNGDQLLRAIYLVGEGDNRADSMELDPQQFALGNNLLGSYDLAKDSQSRVSIYYSNDGGRLTNAEHIAGMPPVDDQGNFSTEPQNGPDVYSVGGVGNVQGPNFCFASKPSTQTSIGVYGWIGNGMGYRVNPSLRPEVAPSTRPAGSTEVKVVCNLDPNERAYRLKMQAILPGRSGITGGNEDLSEGDLINYTLDSTLSREEPFVFEGDSDAGAPSASIDSNDINSAVASRQVAHDEVLSVGELYKIGSAIAICTFRDQVAFNSASYGGGTQSVNAKFEVVRAGRMSAAPGPGGLGNATGTSQIFRLSRGSFVTEYPCQVIELGLRHTLGISISGLTNTIDSGYTYDNIDGQACDFFNGATLGTDSVLNTQNITAGTVQVREDRYSFFRVRYRVAASNDEWIDIPDLYGGKGETQQAVYTYLRVELPSKQRWEFNIEPITGWEIATPGVVAGKLWVLDPRMPEESVTVGDVTTRFNGYEIARAQTNFRIRWLDPRERALEPGGQYGQPPAGSMADPWARLAEVFVYNEVTTTVSSNPEWELVYINTILPNPTTPDYADLAIVGMNIRASREFSNLGQFSVYMNRGLGGFHDYPSVLRDLLTNDRFGVGEIVSAQQIDEASFEAATAFTKSRNYYFDGAISEQLNIRQWGASTARDFLLDLIISNGKFALQPLVEFDAPEPITALFTAGNILEDTFELTYFDQDQRQPPRVSVKWRQEETTGDLDNRGLFPIVREVTVRESSTQELAPLDQLDLSDFCTSQQHAIDRAKFECRFRRLSTHSVKFTTTADQASLGLGKCFRLGMETLTYDQPQNGYIAEDGTVTSWPELADGSYLVVNWDGSSYTETQIKVANGRSDKARGSVFCVADNIFYTQTYKVQSLSFNEEGNIDVEAIHWPTDAQGNSYLVADWDEASNWVIEGQI